MTPRDAVRITTAPTSRSEDIRGRERRYIISMTIRTVAFVAAVAVGPGWLRWVLIAAALVLPYVAVVLANAGNQRSDAFTLPEDPHGFELEGPSSSRPLGPAGS
jgi:Protein of unknown function (DUF3099)